MEFSYVLGDVWVEADGARLLVLPLRFASGPGNGQPMDLIRLEVRDASTLRTLMRNIAKIQGVYDVERV